MGGIARRGIDRLLTLQAKWPGPAWLMLLAARWHASQFWMGWSVVYTDFGAD